MDWPRICDKQWLFNSKIPIYASRSRWVSSTTKKGSSRNKCYFKTYLDKWNHLHDFNSLSPSDAYIFVSKLTIIGSDNGLSPGMRHAMVWTNTGILLIGSLGTNFSEILTEINTFSFRKIHLQMSSGIWRPFCLGPNVLKFGEMCNTLTAESQQFKEQLYLDVIKFWIIFVTLSTLFLS